MKKILDFFKTPISFSLFSKKKTDDSSENTDQNNTVETAIEKDNDQLIAKTSFLSRFSFSKKKEVKEENSLNETETVETKPKKKSLFSNFTLFPKKKEIKVISELPTESKKKSFFSLSFGKKEKIESLPLLLPLTASKIEQNIENLLEFEPP